jgi:hypothetical protein
MQKDSETINIQTSSSGLLYCCRNNLCNLITLIIHNETMDK